MRQVISISLSEDTAQKIRDFIRNSDDYRNKSHFIETAIKRALHE